MEVNKERKKKPYLLIFAKKKKKENTAEHWQERLAANKNGYLWEWGIGQRGVQGRPLNVLSHF